MLTGGRRARRRLDACRGDDGVTFLELLVAMVLFGILVTFAAGPYAGYRRKQEHIGSTRELVAFLRRAQVRAVAEETTYRVDFQAGGTQAQVFKLTAGDACTGTYVAGQLLKPANNKLTYTGASFVGPCGTSSSVYFFQRGTGSKGSVTVSRAGSSTIHTVNVEGLTARVSYV
jgi:prepilin-type N-terminal cleavage/methylation domain-containing protein